MGTPTKVFAYTIDSSALSQTETNFPVCIDLSLIDAGTKTAFFTACRNDGMDIVCSGTLGDVSSPYNRELVNFSQGGETGELFVCVPSVSHLTDTIVYVHAGGGDSAANSTATWTAGGYYTVLHCDDSSSPMVDSCGRQDATAVKTPVYNQAGQVDDSVLLEVASTEYFTGAMPSAGEYSTHPEYYVSGLFRTTRVNWGGIAVFGSDGGANYQGSATAPSDKMAALAINGVSGTKSSVYQTTAATNYADGDWHHVAASFGGASLEVPKLIYDGTDTALTYFNAYAVPLSVYLVGATDVIGIQNLFGGYIDEVRYNKYNKGVNWGQMEYSNLMTPLTFAAFGAVGDVGASRISPLLNPNVLGNSLFRGSLV